MAERVYRKKSTAGVQSPTAFGGAPFTQGGHAADAAIGASWAPPSTVSVQGTAQSGQRVYRKKATATAPQTAQRTYSVSPRVKKEKLQTWFSDAASTIQSTQDYVRQNQEVYNKEYGQEYADRVNELIRKADSVAAYLDYYKDDEETYNSLNSAFSEIKNYLGEFGTHAAAVRDYYGQWDTEEAYRKAVANAAKNEELLAVDLDKLDSDIQYTEGLLRMIKEYRDWESKDPKYYYNEHGHGEAEVGGALQNLKRKMEYYGISPDDKDQLEQTLNAHREKRSQAKDAQVMNAVFNAKNDPEYTKHVSAGAAKDKPIFADYDTIAARMTAEQKENYNYLLSKYGREDADVYFELVRKGIQSAKATDFYEKYLEDTWYEGLFSVVQGLDQFSTGVQNAVGIETDDRVFNPQMVGAMVRENLGENHTPFWYNFKEGKWEDTAFGSTLGQIAYDFGATTANMVPAIGLGAASNLIAPGAGAYVTPALLGISSGGNAYKEALSQGYTEQQARTYGTLIGSSEALLGKVLGSIGPAGKSWAGTAIENATNGIKNAGARFVLQLGGQMLSEATEEGLQEILTPFFENIALDADNTWDDVDWEQAAYSALMGAMSAGLMEGGPAVISVATRQNAQYRALGTQLINGKNGVTIDDAIRIGLSNAKGTDAYNAAVKLQQKVKAGKTVSPYAVGRMVAESQTEQARISKAIETEVVESGKAVGYDAEAVDTVARAAVALNQRVRFAAAGELANPNNAAEYHRDTDTVLLNPVLTDVNRLIGGMLAHEMTHTAEGTKQLQTLAKIAQRMEGADGWRALQEKVRKEYADAGVQLSDPEVQKEALAAWIGEKLFTNKIFAKAVADGDANVGNAFFYLIDRVRRAMGAKKASPRNLAMLERLFMQALENRTLGPREGDVQGAVNGAPVIDLSDHSELAKRVEGAPKGNKTKIIQHYILEVLGNEPFRLSDGKMAVVDRSDAHHIANFARSEMEVAQVAEIKNLVENAQLYADASSDGHNKFDHFWYYESVVRYGNDEYSVFLNVGRTHNDRTYHLYDIMTENKRHRRLNEQPKRPKPNEGYALRSGVSDTNVAQNATDVNTQSMQEGTEISAQGALLPPEYRPGARAEGDNPSVTADAATPPFTQGRHAADAANGADLSIDEAAVLDTAVRSQLQGRQRVSVDTSAIKHTKHAKRYLDMLERELGTPELVRRMWNATQIERPTGTVEIDGRQVDANAYVDAYEAQLPNDAEALEQHLHRLEAENGAVKEQMYLDGMLENHVFGGLKIDLQLFATKRKLELLQLAAGEDGKKMRQFYEKRLLGNDENHCQELINLLAGRPETYNPIANQKTLAKAKEKLDDEKYKSKLRKRLYAYNKHDLFDSEEVAAASLMINDAINRMELEEAANLVIGLSRKGTEAGRAVQAFSMMGRLTPEGVLKTAARYYAKAVDQIVGDGADVGFDKLAKEILVAIEEAEENGISSDAIAERIRSGDGATSSIASGPPSPQGEVKADVKMTREQLVEALTENLAATEGAYLTRDAMTDLIKRAVNECADLKEQVKRYVLKEIRKDDGALAQRIYEVYQKGDLNRAKMKRAMEEALGLPTLTAEDVQYIVEQTAKIQKLEDKPVEQADAIDDLYDYLGAKLPVSFGEKMAAWRKFAMLFNIRTHARNFFANLAYVGVRNVDSAIATGLELMAVKLNWMKPEERAAAFGWHCTAHGQQILETIKERVPEAVLEMTGRGAKYEETSNPLMRHRKMYKSEWLNDLNDWNSEWLEREDIFFFKMAYTNALGQVMTARKATKVTDEMHAIAMKRALEATFRNKNVLSRVLSVPKRGLTSDDWKIRHLAQVYDVVLPFVNTPAAIMEQTAMHSPIGLAVGFAELFGKAWGKSDKAAADIINDFAKGIHGSVLFRLGIMAVQWGILRIGYRSGDKDKAADEMEGRMENAIIIGDTAISIDWLQPLAAPLIMGGAVAEALADQDDDTLDSLFGVGLSAANSLLSLSMLQSFYDAVGSYGGDAATSLSTIAENAISQSVPTLLGQVARILDPVQRKVQDGTLTGSLLNPILAKIPFATRLLDPELDVWGNEVYRTGYADGTGIGINIAQQLAVPWNTKRGTAQDDPISAELLRLYHEHDAGAALPTAVTRKEAKAEGEDWTKLNRLLGGVNRLAVEEFINNKKAYEIYVETGELTNRGEPKKKKETKYYRDMTDEERINVLQNHIYEKAKKEVLGKTAHVPEEYLNESERYFRDLIRRVQSGQRGTFGAAEPAQEPAPQQQQASTSYFDDLLRRMRNNGN